MLAVWILALAAVAAANPNYSFETKNKVYYVETFFKASFFKAFMYCSKMGMDLLSIESEEEFQELENRLINTVKYESNLQFWTAGALMEPKVFHWMNSGLPVGLEKNWLPGEPNNEFGHEECLHVRYQSKNKMGFNDYRCSYLGYIVCQGVKP